MITYFRADASGYNLHSQSDKLYISMPVIYLNVKFGRGVTSCNALSASSLATS